MLNRLGLGNSGVGMLNSRASVQLISHKSNFG